jgi:hypothetical protein
MLNASEQDIQKSILEYLRIKKYVPFKHNSTQFGIRNGQRFAFANGEKGISDIIACSPTGGFVAIEVKKPGGKASPEQLDFIERIKATGAIALVAYSLEDVLDVLENQAR